MSILKRLDGDHIIQGALTVLGGINDPTISQVKTRLATTEDDVRVAQGEIAELPTVAEVEGMIDAQVPELVIIHTPKNLGRFYASHPTSFFNMDRWVVYDEDDDPIQRGVYYSDNGTPTRITTASAQALQLYIAEGMQHIAWAEAQGTYGTSADYGIESVFQSLGAVSAFIETLAAKQAFIESLFTNQIEVPDDGRIRYYTGQGVQRRAVELANESVSWIDTPDTTPATDEQLRGRIGRLGVGDAVLMDGEFQAPLDTTNIVEEVLGWGGSLYGVTSIKRKNGNIHIAFRQTTTGYLVQTISEDNGVTWSTLYTIRDADTWYPSFYEEDDETLRIGYMAYPSGYLYEKLSDDGTTWGAEITILADDQYANPEYKRTSDNILHLMARQGSTGYIIETLNINNIWNSSTSTVAASSSDFVAIEVDSDGILHAVFRDDSGTPVVKETTFIGGAWSSIRTLTSTDGIPKLYKLLNGKMILVCQEGASLVLYDYSTSGTLAANLTIPMTYSDDNYSLLQNEHGELEIYLSDPTDGICRITLQRYARLGAGIIESGGDDTTGYWEKWSNGTMRCWGINLQSTSSASSAQRVYNITTPQDFIPGTWSVSAIFALSSLGNRIHFVVTAFPTLASANKATARSFDWANVAVTGYGYINWSAEGKWA